MRIDWEKVSRNLEPLGGMLCGAVCTLIVIACLACASGKARQGTVDHNRVSATANVPVTVDANADVRAEVAALKAQFETLNLSLMGPVNVGPVGSNVAGGDVTTVDSLTAQVLAKTLASTLKWSVIISLLTVAIYVLCHRFRSTRGVLDWCKGEHAKCEVQSSKFEEIHGASRRAGMGIEHCRHGSGTE